jgi:hypothetical protein
MALSRHARRLFLIVGKISRRVHLLRACSAPARAAFATCSPPAKLERAIGISAL